MRFSRGLVTAFWLALALVGVLVAAALLPEPADGPGAAWQWTFAAQDPPPLIEHRGEP